MPTMIQKQEGETCYRRLKQGAAVDVLSFSVVADQPTAAETGTCQLPQRMGRYPAPVL
jgi:hypothetical protein